MAAPVLFLCTALLAATPDDDSRYTDGPVLHECNRLIDSSDDIPIVHPVEDCQLNLATMPLQPVPMTRVTRDFQHAHPTNSTARDPQPHTDGLRSSIAPQRAACDAAPPSCQPRWQLPDFAFGLDSARECEHDRHGYLPIEKGLRPGDPKGTASLPRPAYALIVLYALVRLHKST